MFFVQGVQNLNLNVIWLKSGTLFNRLKISCNLRMHIGQAKTLDVDLQAKLSKSEFT